MRQRARIDANHGAIVEALKRCGWHVESTAQLGKGFPDLVAARAGVLKLIEVKDGAKPPSERRLTADEATCHQRFAAAGCPVVVIERVEDVASLG